MNKLPLPKKVKKKANFQLPASPWPGLLHQIVSCKLFVVNESFYHVAPSRWGEGEFVYKKLAWI